MSILQPYLSPIVTALALFPILAVLFTAPYMVHQYRRLGGIATLRTLIVYSFILYLMCAYFLTMLPLPERAEVAKLTTANIQLIPFHSVVNFVQKTGFAFADPATWLPALKTKVFFEILANVVLTVPLGVYLRYYFGCTLKRTMLLGLCLSLVFELTQLSGLFFIYPRPYRICDVDDLITNTSGAVLGWLVAGPLTRLLPSRARIDEMAMKKSLRVTLTRRIFADLLDWFLLLSVMGLVLMQANMLSLKSTLIAYVALVPLYFVLTQWLCHGKTIGKALVNVRVVSEDGSRAKLWQMLVRYVLLDYVLVPLLGGALLLLLAVFSSASEYVPTIALAATALLIFVLAGAALARYTLKKKNRLPHGALSRTKLVSTLPVTGELDEPLPPDDLYQPDEMPPEEKPTMLN